MKTQEVMSLKRIALAIFGFIAVVAVVIIVYNTVDRPTALVFGGILAVILFIVDWLLIRAEAKESRAPSMQTAQGEQPNQVTQKKLSLNERDIQELVWGLWATQDPNEPDYRDGIMQAGNYRKSCADALRKMGKKAIPYLEPHADKSEVAQLLKELR